MKKILLVAFGALALTSQLLAVPQNQPTQFAYNDQNKKQISEIRQQLLKKEGIKVKISDEEMEKIVQVYFLSQLHLFDKGEQETAFHDYFQEGRVAGNAIKAGAIMMWSGVAYIPGLILYVAAVNAVKDKYYIIKVKRGDTEGSKSFRNGVWSASNDRPVTDFHESWFK